MMKNLRLSIETDKKTVEIDVHMEKMNESRTSLSSGYPDSSGKMRIVRTVPVITRSDIDKPRRLDDIETIVDRSRVHSVVCIQKGMEDPVLVPVDKSEIQSLFESSRELKVISTIPNNNLKPYMFDGSHYYLEIYGKKDKKIKVIREDDKRMYNIIYHGLRVTDQAFIAKYVSYNREKFCAIYSDPTNGLILSNLHYSNNFRPNANNLAHIIGEGEASLVTLVSGGISKERLDKIDTSERPLFQTIFDNLSKKTKSQALETSMLRDKYEELLHRLIDMSKANPDHRPVLDLGDLIVDEKGDLDDFLL